MDLTDDQIKDRYLTSLEALGHPSDNSFVIGMVGIVGSGKSTVASSLAEHLGVPVASNDAIRRYFNSIGIEGATPRQDLLQIIAESTTRYLCQRHISHIIDNDLLKFYDLARANVEEFGANFYLVHVTCPESVILSRIEDRLKSTAGDSSSNLSRADRVEYERRKQVYKASSMPARFDFTFDTAKDLGPQVIEFGRYIKQEGAKL